MVEGSLLFPSLQSQICLTCKKLALDKSIGTGGQGGGSLDQGGCGLVEGTGFCGGGY